MPYGNIPLFLLNKQGNDIHLYFLAFISILFNSYNINIIQIPHTDLQKFLKKLVKRIG